MRNAGPTASCGLAQLGDVILRDCRDFRRASIAGLRRTGGWAF